MIRLYQVRPRKDKRGFDLMSDALPFGGLCGVPFGNHSRFQVVMRTWLATEQALAQLQRTPKV